MSEATGTILWLAVFALLVIASIWVLRRTHRSDAVGSILKWILVVVGLASGIGLSFFTYQPNPDFRVEGLPVPIALFERHGDGWIDFVNTTPMGLVILLLNALFVSAALHACVLTWCWIRKRPARRSSTETGGGP